MTNLDSILKSRDITLPTKVCLVKTMVFPVHVWMWELDCKESRVLKNWCFWSVVLEKTLESPLDCKETQPIPPKGDQSWLFIGRTDVEAETPILWPADAKSWLIWKDPDAGKGWGQEEKGTTEDEMAGWHHQLNGHGFGWTLSVGVGQGGLVCCSSWGCKESDTIEWLNWTELHVQFRNFHCQTSYEYLFKIINIILMAVYVLPCISPSPKGADLDYCLVFTIIKECISEHSYIYICLYLCLWWFLDDRSIEVELEGKRMSASLNFYGFQQDSSQSSSISYILFSSLWIHFPKPLHS